MVSDCLEEIQQDLESFHNVLSYQKVALVDQMGHCVGFGTQGGLADLQVVVLAVPQQYYLHNLAEYTDEHVDLHLSQH